MPRRMKVWRYERSRKLLIAGRDPHCWGPVPSENLIQITAVDRARVSSLHYKLRGKPNQANRTVDVLSEILCLAEAWG